LPPTRGFGPAFRGEQEEEIPGGQMRRPNCDANTEDGLWIEVIAGDAEYS
jgi:hypothetical protein